MALYQRKGSSVWYYDVTDASGVRRRRSTKTSDRKQAEEVHDKSKAQSWDIRAGRTPNYTWEQAVARFLDEKGHKASIADDAQMLLWWTGHFKGLALKSITRDLVMHFAGKKKTETTPARANRYIAVIRTLLRKAEREWLWVQRAPALTQFKEPRGRVRYLKNTEVEALLQALPDHQRDLTEFALAVGMRQSNVLGLRWDQIDMDRRMLTVPGDEVKNRRDFSTVLNADAMRVLNRCAGKHPERVFTYCGRPLAQANTRSWRKALKRVGITDFRWHDLRHTWASSMVQSGVPLHVVQELGGWEKSDMVRRYGHLSPDHLHKYAAQIERKTEVPA